MKPEKYNFRDHLKGDTFNGIEFTLIDSNSELPIDITDALITIQFKSHSKTGLINVELNVGSGITITDAENGVFVIDSFLLDWQPKKYYYDVQITFPNGVVKTYIEGTFLVIQDVTN